MAGAIAWAVLGMLLGYQVGLWCIWGERAQASPVFFLNRVGLLLGMHPHLPVTTRRGCVMSALVLKQIESISNAHTVGLVAQNGIGVFSFKFAPAVLILKFPILDPQFLFFLTDEASK